MLLTLKIQKDDLEYLREETGYDMKSISVSVEDNPEVEYYEVVENIRKALLNIKSGNSKPIENLDENFEQIDVKKYLDNRFGV